MVGKPKRANYFLFIFFCSDNISYIETKMEISEKGVS